MSNQKKPKNPLLVEPRRTSVFMHPGWIAAELERLQREMVAAENERHIPAARRRVGDGPPSTERLEALADEYDEKVAAARDESVEVVLEELSHRRHQAVIEANPPSEEQAQLGIGADPVGYQESLVRACIVEPKLTDEQFDEFIDQCSDWNWQRLVEAAFQFRKGFDLPNGSAASLIREMSATGLRRQDGTESPSDDSTAGSPDDGPST